MTGPEPVGERWLSAALSGELPEPRLRRWQPLRVGILNLWEYDQAEFWFADGRLVLRGGNGAGKTKVLELTTLMLLRGEIGPTVLDPFGSQHRTMRFNLLPTGDDDDPRPSADAGLGYAWVEFGRIDENGEPQFFVCGLGVSARRGSGTSAVTTWHLITRMRPGRDLHLATAGRPLDQRELKKISGVTVPENATRYRTQVAGALFGLGPDAYDNLTELLKQLRRPKLGERLNPASLADTLRAALPPLASSEINQLADGWENLEKLRAAVEETRTAASQVAGFVRSGWMPWAQTVVRRRADALSSATTALDDTTKDRRLAERDLNTANEQVIDLERRVAAAGSSRNDLEIELRELLESQAFQDAAGAVNRVGALRKQLDDLEKRHAAAQHRYAAAEKDLSTAALTARGAAKDIEDAGATASQASSLVQETAQPAGLHSSASRYLPSHDLAALRVDLSKRHERFTRLRELRRSYDKADREAAKSAETLDDRTADLTAAAEQRESACDELSSAVDTVRGQIREWNAGTLLARADERTVEDWCDLVAELTAADPAEGQRVSPAAEIARHVGEIREDLRARRVDLEHERSAVSAEQSKLSSKLEEVLARTERPPEPPHSWYRRDRPTLADKLGAPFWRCVQPAGEPSATEVDLLEAVLAAAGLLDAWVNPDGGLSTAVDGTPVDTSILAGEVRTTGNLTSVLEPTPAGGVAAPTIRAVLAAIGWYESRPEDDRSGVWLAADGTWRCAALTGRAESIQPASYLGATAREAARQREIEQLHQRLAELGLSINELEERIKGIDRDLSRLSDEAVRAPGERIVTDAVSTLRERERRVDECQRKVSSAEEVHRGNEAVRDTTWAAFSEYAGEHAFPVHDLAKHDVALQTYRRAVDHLAHQVELLELRTKAGELADNEHAAAQGRLNDIEAEREDLREQRNQAGIQLATAEKALTSDAQAKLDRRHELDTSLKEADRGLEDLREELTDARLTSARADETLAKHEGRRQGAEQDRDVALAAWWEVYDSGLSQPVGLTEPDRRTVESARESTRAARRELANAKDEDRLWRLCYSKFETLRQGLLPDRDARVVEPERDGGVPRVVLLADSTSGWQAPAAAADQLADQVREQEGAFDNEQQRVLTTLLGSTFIEHLKDRLDYTARTFTDINAQLTSHPTRHGNAVQLRWNPDPTDPDAGTVIDALAQGYQQLSRARQETVRSFLARKIDEARSDASATGSGDWREQLSTALDYRGWLKISLEYRPGATSRWVPFDAARHGAKSGGEKVVLLSQPLFAAAVVAYNAAGERAPRCVWLDEAMTGVDEEIKASFMGLTVGFDLDVMLTAHDEWCKYPTVPAVAVYDLARHKGLPGVDAVPYLWCGGEWTVVDASAADRTTVDAALPSEGLFAEQDADL
ncbi:TIGR02680 family protein [Saccharopolyspora cebuensis]|uniref:TIGR02680 family protein n=1 Tax=Saccharopolyspora cebuensis TaxID=418759 RepID=A0ABV4CLC4_9PSEU